MTFSDKVEKIIQSPILSKYQYLNEAESAVKEAGEAILKAHKADLKKIVSEIEKEEDLDNDFKPRVNGINNGLYKAIEIVNK